ncbi:MAG: ECF-type sigma factor [Gemmatimonadaceae bacterium]
MTPSEWLLQYGAKAATASKRGGAPPLRGPPPGWAPALRDRCGTTADGALDDALRQLETAAPQQAKVVALRFFGGLEIDETAHALGISLSTVKREIRARDSSEVTRHDGMTRWSTRSPRAVRKRSS